MTALSRTELEIPTTDGTADAYLVRPDDGNRHPGILFFMDAFGIRPGLRAMADRLAALGHTVLVPNYLYRAGRSPVVELPAFIDDSNRPAIFEKLLPTLQALTPELVARDLPAYDAALTGSAWTADGPYAVTGYCMGAPLALRAAASFPEHVAAAAGFHGGPLVTDDADSPHLLAGSITAEVCLAQAAGDYTEEQLIRLDGEFARTGVRYHSEVVDAAHGWTQSDTVAYDKAADDRHWELLEGLLGRSF